MGTRTVAFTGFRIDGKAIPVRHGELEFVFHDTLREWTARADFAGLHDVPDEGTATFETDEVEAEGYVIKMFESTTSQGTTCRFQGSGALDGLARV